MTQVSENRSLIVNILGKTRSSRGRTRITLRATWTLYATNLMLICSDVDTRFDYSIYKPETLTTAFSLLNWRTGNGPVWTIDATITLFWSKYTAAIGTLVKPLTTIPRHFFAFFKRAFWTFYGAFKIHKLRPCLVFFAIFLTLIVIINSPQKRVMDLLRGLSHVPPLNLRNSRRCYLCTIIWKSSPELSFDVSQIGSIKLFGNTWNDCKSDDRIYANVLD